MLLRLLTPEDDVLAAERRLLVYRTALADQAARAHASVKARLARPDALLVAAGLGALYGLWAPRARRRAAASGGERPRRLPNIPGWLIRMVASVLFTRFVAENAAEETVDEAVGGHAPGDLGVGP